MCHSVQCYTSFQLQGWIIILNWLEYSAICPWNDTQESIRLINKNSGKIFFFLSFFSFFSFSFSSFSRPTQGQNLPMAAGIEFMWGELDQWIKSDFLLYWYVLIIWGVWPLGMRGSIFGWGGQFFTWCFPISKESLHLYPRISSCPWHSLDTQYVDAL